MPETRNTNKKYDSRALESRILLTLFQRLIKGEVKLKTSLNIFKTHSYTLIAKCPITYNTQCCKRSNHLYILIPLLLPLSQTAKNYLHEREIYKLRSQYQKFKDHNDGASNHGIRYI